MLTFVHSQLHAISSRIAWLAARRRLSITLVGLIGFGGSAALGLLVGIPEPSISDEYGYLLAAETFATGRLTNPTHPMWIHFESPHQIHQPTYMSKYPPAQGLVLAAGQVITGYPIVGVWLSMGIMCAAICWMLYTWVPSRWALLGGFLVVVHPGLGISGYWAQGYMGGAVAATGGALIAGALPRVMQERRIVDAFLFGVGLAVLANSRPFEGLLFSLPASVVLVSWLLIKGGPDIGESFRFIILPLITVIALTGMFMGYYNLRVTGNILRMPYQVHEDTYATSPLFLWQNPRAEPSYRQGIIRDVHENGLKAYEEQRSIAGFWFWKKRAFQGLWHFYFGWTLTFPILTMLPVLVPWVFRNRWPLFAFSSCSFVLAGLLTTAAVLNHYAAPITAFAFFLLLQALYFWKSRDRVVGRFAVCFVIVLCVYLLARSTHAAMARDRTPAPSRLRATIQERLEKAEGRQLILVRYSSQHTSHKGEWVFNKADIDRAKVIWAHDMGSARNRELLEYFGDRHVWLLEVNGDRAKPKLQPYSQN